MSTAIRQLRAAVRLFRQHVLEEDIDPEQLRDVIDQLEYELEWLYEPAADRARLRAKSEAEIEEIIRTRGLGLVPKPKP